MNEKHTKTTFNIKDQENETEYFVFFLLEFIGTKNNETLIRLL